MMGFRAEGGTQAQADEIGFARLSEAAPQSGGTQGPVGDDLSGSAVKPGAERKSPGPTDWEAGWKKRASLVAVCTLGLLVFLIWAKTADQPSELIQQSEPPPIAVGSLVEIKQGFFGCLTKSDIKQVEILAFARHDATAASLYRQSHGCPVFNKGEVVEVSDTAPSSELYCLRWRGNQDCYWFPNQFIQRPSPKPPAASGGSDF